MNNIHGKKVFLLILILFAHKLLATPLATYTLQSSNYNPYIKEAVEITFTAEQVDKTDVMFFFLEPKENQSYKITLLQKESTELGYHHKKTSFHYLLFPLKDGKIEVDFDFTIKVASDEAVAQVYEGSRDNVKWIETDNTNIKLTPLTLHIKKIKKGVQLVGDFQIDSFIDRTNVDAYEAVNVKYHLTGTGFDEFHLNFIQKQKGIDIFEDITKHYNKATAEGFKIKQEYNYALIAKENFIIPSQTIYCFSPKQNRYYKLKTHAYNIKVKKLSQKDILDDQEYPKVEYLFSTLQDFFLYMLLFFAGYFSAKIQVKKVSKNRNKEYDDIYQAKSPKEMLLLLTNKYASLQVFKPFHKRLENIVYGQEDKKHYSQIKKEIFKKIKEIE